MKRTASARNLDPNEPHSAIFAAARREHNEQVGGIAQQRDTLYAITGIALLIALVAVGGAVWDHQNNHAVPYVLKEDKLGNRIPLGRIDAPKEVSPADIARDLRFLIGNIRSVVADVKAQRAMVGDAVAFIDRNGAANAFLMDWYSQHDPFKRAADATVWAQVDSVLPLAGGLTWTIDWTEDTTDRTGRLISSIKWRAQVTVTVRQPTKDEEIAVNPNGIFVESLAWGPRQ